MSDKISSESASISNISDVETEGSQSPSKLKFILSIIINLSNWISNHDNLKIRPRKKSTIGRYAWRNYVGNIKQSQH